MLRYRGPNGQKFGDPDMIAELISHTLVILPYPTLVLTGLTMRQLAVLSASLGSTQQQQHLPVPFGLWHQIQKL